MLRVCYTCRYLSAAFVCCLLVHTVLRRGVCCFNLANTDTPLSYIDIQLLCIYSLLHIVQKDCWDVDQQSMIQVCVCHSAEGSMLQAAEEPHAEHMLGGQGSESAGQWQATAAGYVNVAYPHKVSFPLACFQHQSSYAAHPVHGA